MCTVGAICGLLHFADMGAQIVQSLQRQCMVDTNMSIIASRNKDFSFELCQGFLCSPQNHLYQMFLFRDKSL